MLGNLTAEAAKNPGETTKRQKNAFDLAKKYGVEIKAFYYTMGKFDWIVIADAPDNETALKALLELASGGTARTRTMLAFPAEDAAKMTEDM